MSEGPGREPEPDPSSAAKDLRWRKKIIVCCDGTGQKKPTCDGTGQKKSRPVSNVWRIYDCIKDQDQDGIQQKKKYWRGTGTGKMKIPGLLKQATGAGISEDIREVYRFICEEYESDRSMICLIGYSRGAYTVRCVAQFIQDAGLLRQESIQHLPALFSLWEKKGQKVGNEPLAMENSRDGVRVRVCAVWDTVSSLGPPMIAPIPQPAPTRMRAVNSTLSPNIDQAFQALALHEHRRHFLPIVWNPDRPSSEHGTLEQCWFTGYHCDIGGGRKEEFLAHIALIWMMARLGTLLEFDLQPLWDPNSPIYSWRVSDEVKVQDSFRGIFSVGGSKRRKPRCHFWGEKFKEEQPPPLVQDGREEKMHHTVRRLLTMKSIGRCELLNTPPEQGNTPPGRFTWNLYRKKNDEETRYQVRECDMIRQEKVWLDKWVRTGLRDIHRRSQPGDRSPRTEIAALLCDRSSQ